jgi:hypothetical protein
MLQALGPDIPSTYVRTCDCSLGSVCMMRLDTNNASVAGANPVSIILSLRLMRLVKVSSGMYVVLIPCSAVWNAVRRTVHVMNLSRYPPWADVPA